MKFQIGLQLFSVYEALRDHFEAGLKTFSDMGYKNVEFAAFDPGELQGKPPIAWKAMSAKELLTFTERCGVHIISASVSLPYTVNELMEAKGLDWDKTAVFNSEIGSEGPVITMMFFKTKDEILRFADYLNTAGKSCKKAGVNLFYHNHFQEFQKFDGKYAMDILLENTDPNCVKVEFDTYWAMRGGVDPIAYLKKLGGRCILVHQKDLPVACTRVNLLKDFTGEVNIEKFSEAQPHEFIEVGDGVMDIQGIIRTLREIGAAKYLIIEQDHSALTPVESALRSYNNINRLLNGAFFLRNI